MARETSLNTAAINALFAAKRADDLLQFGKLVDTANNGTQITAQGLLIASNQSAITAAQASIVANGTSITQLRLTACTSTTRPAAPVFGQRIRETNTEATGFWDGTKWVMTDTKEQPYTPVVTTPTNNIVLGAGNSRTGFFVRMGSLCHYAGTVFLGGAGFNGGTNQIRISLPFQAAGAQGTRFGTAIISARGNDHAGTTRVDGNNDYLYMLADYLDTGGAPNRVQSATVANTDGSGTPGTGVPRFQGNYTWDSNNSGYLNWEVWFVPNYAVLGR